MSPEDRAERYEMIRELRRHGATFQQIADRYGVTPQRIHAIAKIKSLAQQRGRQCPACQAPSLELWARDYPGGVTRRRRKCTVCGHRWNRIEVDEEILSTTSGGSPTAVENL